MAMNEDRGYCLKNAFKRREMVGDDLSYWWEAVKDILGERLGYVVCSKTGCNHPGESYIVDALMGGNGELGFKVARILEQLIPVCECSKYGRPIVCTDLVNLHEFPAKIHYYNGKWELVGTKEESSTEQGKMCLCDDERYLVFIQNCTEEVCIYLYKK